MSRFMSLKPLKNILEMPKPYIIIEAANTHGGDYDYLMQWIESYSIYGAGFGLKFQPLHPDKIATSDYPHYKLYQQLHFDNKTWKRVVKKAVETQDVWFDIFDSYGVDILAESLDNITGIKFQSSVLYNYEVFDLLEAVDLSKVKIILNVAAQPIRNIKEIVKKVYNQLNPQEILLELGYQAYPTKFENSGYSKLEVIKEHFNNRIVFADHADGKTDDAVWLPVMVAMQGVDVIEKHVMLGDRETKYDYYSSLTPPKFNEMVNQIDRFTSLSTMPFFNEGERQYLNTTIMIPILKQDKKAGELLNIKEDFIYRRSGNYGLNVREIESLQSSFHILATDKKAGETLQKEDFKKAVIATVIACRLKSSRLPQKALLPIGGMSSVERCIKSCLEFKQVNHTILATSDLNDDAKLQDYTYRGDVIFHKGDPEDVINRYLGIADQLKVDVIIRITADMPFVSHEIVYLTLQEHFRVGADYTVPRTSAVGTSAEVINVSALRKVKTHFTSANYSEYMTWYFQNNPEHFMLNFIDLPSDLVRDYRLTLDYPEDLDMFNKLQAYFDEMRASFDIRKAFSFLDEHSEINKINAHLTLRYKSDSELIKTLNRVTKIL
jgi:N,N'-diacetyllegionaminate synthase